MGGAPRHCSLRPRTHHGPWSPPIHHGCPRPRIFYGHLENLPLSLRLYVLSLSRFPLGPSLCRGSLPRPGGRLSRLLRPGGRLSRLLRPGWRLSRLLRRPARVTSRVRRPARVTSRLCGFVCPALVGSCLIGPTWTWPSVPSPGSTSAPPPSWIMLRVRRLKAALWGGGGLCHESGCHSPHYNCTSPMDCISHHSLHSHIPIHHYTNHTAVTNH